MKSTVAKIVTGLTNTGRFPFAYADLTCGHSAKVDLVPATYACWHCSRPTAGPSSEGCPCGKREGVKTLSTPNPHVEADRLTKVGDVVECEHCDRNVVATAKMRAALLSGEIVHTRFRNWCGQGIVYAYRRASDSPSGVFQAATLDAPDFDKLFAELRSAGLISSSLSPLSPTEGLGR